MATSRQISHARAFVGILAAAAGLVSVVVLSPLPRRAVAGPGIALGGPTTSRGELAALIAIAVAGLAVLSWLGVRMIVRFRAAGSRRALWACEPLAIGLAVPVLAWVLDRWWIEGTVLPLAAGGAGLGLLACGRRLDWIGGRALDPHGVRRIVVAAAVLVPLLLVAPGDPWWDPLNGDEPHYLVIAQSLWDDGDVRVGDQYRERAYWSYYPAELAPHSKVGADGGRYSMHHVGLGVWLAPWYGLGQGLGEASFTLLIRGAMILWAGAFALVLFCLIEAVGGVGAALRGTATVVLTAPLLFMAPHVFTEVPALTLSAGAYLLLRRRPGPAGAAAAGAMLAVLPWLHVKYILLAITEAAIGFAWVLSSGATRHPDAATGRSRALAGVALSLPLLVSGAGHLAYTWVTYGSLSPLAVPLGSDPGVRATAFGAAWSAYFADAGGAARTAIGYLFDQKDGLLFHAPQYLLAAAGLGFLWRRGRGAAGGRDRAGHADSGGRGRGEPGGRGEVVALLLILASLWFPYALSQETGFWSPPARPLVPVLWTLAVPMGVALGQIVIPGRSHARRSAGLAIEAERGARRGLAAAAGALLAWGAGMTLVQAVQSDLIYHDAGTRHSLLLQRYGAPRLPLWSGFPAWVQYDAPQWMVSIFWLLLAVATAAVLWRQGSVLGAAAPTREREPSPSILRRTAPGFRGAAGTLWALGTVLVLCHHLLVPVSALHRPYSFGRLALWQPVSPPQRVWPEPEVDSVWIGGDDYAELLLSSPETLERIALELYALASVRYRLQVGTDVVSGLTGPRSPSVVELEPGSGYRWGTSYFYPLRISCDGGVSPAALGMNDDGRHLGLQLRPSGAAAEPIGDDPRPIRDSRHP